MAVRDNMRMNTCARAILDRSSAILAAIRAARSYVGIRTMGSGYGRATGPGKSLDRADRGQVRPNPRRLIQNIRANPEATRSHVEGSGTSPPLPPPDPHDSIFFFLPVPTTVVPFFLTGPQTLGNGGGAIGMKFPGVKGSYKLSGGVGPRPGTGLRFNRADWKGTGGLTTAVPVAGWTGSSNFATGGSDEELACCGTSSTRFAHRVRAVILPSVMTVSPFFKETRCRVQ